MNFLERLRAMGVLGDSMRNLSDRSRRSVIVADDEARFGRIGDIDGQTDRARKYAAELDKKLLAR
jgi:hypothetical protein